MANRAVEVRRRSRGASSEAPRAELRTPAQLAWRQLRKHPMALAGGAVLVVLYLLVVFAEFLAPYSLDFADRERFFHPPILPRFADSQGVSLRPFVHGTTLADPGLRRYEADPTRRYYLRFFVRGEPYRLFGLFPSDVHLFGVDPPGRIFLLGTDQSGRDQFSRILYGSRISMTIGLYASAVTIPIGLLYGGISGYYGGRIDNVMMRLAEFVISIPDFYLLLTLSAVLPTQVGCTTRFYLIILILSFIGWAGFSRIIRGIVLSLKEQEYVLAAKAAGLGDLRIIARHILPQTASFVIVVVTLGIPGAILGESALSFIGFGIREPCSSWGNLLTQASNLPTLILSPWLLFPGLFIIAAVVAFNVFGDGLRDALDPRVRAG
ncbi:MAG: ABC transporter permease [Armatimonadota bacterium]|nr:ABC transporter permease [Armatimonadota bacterium]